MKKEKIEVLTLSLVGITCFGIIFFVLMKHIFPVIAPFLAAWFFATAVSGPAEALSRKSRISPKLWRPTLAVGAVLLVFCVLGIFVWQTVDLIRLMLTDMGAGGEIYTMLARLSEPKFPFVDSEMPEGLAERLGEAIGELVGLLLERLGALITNVASFIPKALIFLLVTLISLIYFAIDIDRINRFVMSLFPKKTRDKLARARRDLFSIICKYVKSYLQIMLITFVIMLVGFLILGVKRAFAVAAVIALLDLLPILGVGIVLVPWSACAFALGNGRMGVGILVIFIAYTVIREIVEPKILGKSLNVHPVLTLISLYVGYALFGAAGLVVLPVCAVLLSGLFKKDDAAKVG